MDMELQQQNQFIVEAHEIVESGRNAAYQSINVAMVTTYWRLGRHIILEEQQGQKRAEYGSQLIKLLSEDLTLAFGKGYSPRALRQFRQFYLTFPDIEKWNTRVPFLSWSHFHYLIRIKDEKERNWYLTEAAKEWTLT